MAQPTPSSSTVPDPNTPTLSLPTTPAGLLDLLVSLHLSLWPALSLAVSLYTPQAPSQENPTPASTGTEVRDWLAGAISNMIQDGQIRDLDDLEEVIVQVVGDEFEVMIEDGSEALVAQRIWRGVEMLKSGDKDTRTVVEEDITRLWNVWMQRGGDKAVANAAAMGKAVEVADDAQDTSGDEDEEDDEEMGDAPQLVDAQQRPRREKTPPEVDEDGFTTVKTKKRR